MSLLQKASIITTPTAYAEDYLYSIKPAYALGSELVTNGNYSNGTTSWDATRNATLTASNNVLTVASDSSTYGGAARQVVTVVVGKKYKWEFTINEANDTRVGIRNGTADFSSGAIILDINDLGVGTHTYTFKATATSVSIILGTMTLSGQEKYSNVSLKEITDADFDFDRNSTGTRVNEDYLIETVATNTPRIDYTNGEPSILLEPSRTNLVLKSNDISNGGGNALSNLQINSSNNLSPEGINNAQEIEVTSASQPKVESVAVSNATLYAVSGYVKKVTGDFFGLGFYQGDIGNQYAKFNLDTGTFVAVQSNGVTSQSATNIYNCEIIAYKNNWYRITCNILTGSDASKSNFKWMAMSESAFNSGVVGDKFLIYGRQAEQASYATSLIHTSGSTVTRSADVSNNAGNSDLINSTEGVVYAEIKALGDDGTNRGLGVSDGTVANRVNILFTTSSTTLRGFINVGSVVVADFSTNRFNILEFHKIAIKYKANDCSFYIDGREISIDTSSTMPSANTLNEAQFDVGAGVLDFYGYTKSFIVFKEALTDLELEKLTGYNNHELYMNYYNRLSYLGLAEEYNVESDINNYIL